MERIYISGKIGNLPLEVAKAKFDAVANIIRESGNRPMNPFDNGVVTPPEMSVEDQWKAHMRADVIMLCESDRVYMLPCWKDSKGAKIEHDIAVSLGIPTEYLN